MACRSTAAEKILFGALDSSISLTSVMKWLLNPRLTPSSEGLLKEEDGSCDQCDFVNVFLSFLREAARRIKVIKNGGTRNRSGDGISVSKESTDDVDSPEASKFISVNNDEYLQNFPDLSNSSRKICSKSVKRINPTPVPKEANEGRRNPVGRLSNSLSEETKVPYSCRFSSRKFRGSPFQLKDVIEKALPPDKEKIPLPDCRVQKLTISAELYSLILKNGLVPNISYEMKFMLNLFDFIMESEGILKFCVENEDDLDLNILIYKEDFEYFCFEVFIRLETFLVRLDLLARRNLYLKMTSMSSHSSSYSDILERLKPNHRRSQGCPHIKLEKLVAFLGKSLLFEDSSTLESISTKFNDIHEKWMANLSERTLHNDLDAFLSDKNDIMSFYTFGKAYADLLLYLLDESSKKEKANAAKRQQLSARMALSSELDDKFTYFEIFHKLVLDYLILNYSLAVIFIKYWLFHYIQLLTNGKPYDFEDIILADVRSRILSGLKIKLVLAKFLGYIEFSSSKIYSGTTEVDKSILDAMYACFLPSIDVKEFIMRSVNLGQLTDTIPWIVQFLSMAEKNIASHSYFKSVLVSLVSVCLASSHRVDSEGTRNIRSPESSKDPLLKLNIFLPNSRVKGNPDSLEIECQNIALKKTALLFIKIWIGKLFDEKILGEDVFFELYKHYIEVLPSVKPRGNNFLKISMDATSVINDDAFLAMCCHFSKIKYWESSNDSITSRYIRPLLLTPTVDEPSQDIQILLEERFLKDHLTIASLVDFVSSRVFSLFQDTFLIMMNQATGNSCEASNNSENQLSKHLNNLMADTVMRAVESLKLLSPSDTNVSVFEAGKSICLNRLSHNINEWLVSSGYMEVLKKDHNFVFCLDKKYFSQGAKSKKVMETDSDAFQGNKDYKLSETFKNINFFRCQLLNKEHVEQDINRVLKDIALAFQELNEEVEDDLKLLKELYFLSWDYILDLITNQPQLLTSDVLKETTKLWAENKYGDIEQRFLCPRVIEAAALQDKSTQKLSSQHLGKLIFWVLKFEVLSLKQLEEQFVAILRFNWAKTELDFILILCSQMKDVISTAEVNSEEMFAIMNIIDFLCESVSDIRFQIS